MVIRRKKAIGVGTAAAGGLRTQPLNNRKPSSNSGLSLPLNKKLGQHLLKNPGVLEKIATAAEIKSSDTVLEIGPGTGNLTIRLLPLARRVIALDVDERMVGEVKKRAMGLGYQNLDVRLGDALHSDLGSFDICTANLPYQISSPFVFKLLAHRPLFRCAVLMFQKEFAERLAAEPGNECYSRLAVNTQLFVKVERVCTVKAGSFTPPPKVDSIVVKLTPRKPQPQIDFREWDGMLRLCFMRKRRTLYSNFTVKTVLQLLDNNYRLWYKHVNNKSEISDNPLPSIKELVIKILNETELSQSRSVSLAAADFLRLLVAFNKNGIHFCNVVNKNVLKEPGQSDTSNQKDAFNDVENQFYMHMTLDDDGDNDDRDDANMEAK